MSPKEIQEHLSALDDQALIAKMREAGADMEMAAETDQGSEWHEACFAACLVYAKEVGRRGISSKTITTKGQP